MACIYARAHELSPSPVAKSAKYAPLTVATTKCSAVHTPLSVVMRCTCGSDFEPEPESEESGFFPSASARATHSVPLTVVSYTMFRSSPTDRWYRTRSSALG